MDAKPPFDDPAVATCFATFPEPDREGLMILRALIYDIAARTPGVGPVQETLKWGQPAYLTPDTKSGSTIRLGRPKTGGIALYAHCQTSLISDFRALFPKDFRYDGNRAVHLNAGHPLPLDQLSLLISNALTYHQKSRK